MHARWSGFFILGWLGALAMAGAGDWRQFRGPHGRGVAGESASAFGREPPRRIGWRVSLEGRGLSSPIVVGARIFLTYATGHRQDRLRVACFRTADGARLWERQFWATGRTLCHEKTSVAAATPASDGSRVFAFFSSGDLVCLDLEGNLLWLRGLTRDYPNASNSLGMSSSPVVAGDVLVVQVETDAEAFAAGLDVPTGVNRWKLPRPKMANWSSPIVLPGPADAHPVVVLQSGDGLCAVDAAAGSEVWRYAEGAATIPSSALGDEVLVVPSHGLTALKPGAPGLAPARLWRAAQIRPDTASPIVLGDRVYVVNAAGVLNCGDLATGQRLWQVRLKGPFSSSPVAAGSFLCLFNEKGLGQMVDLSKSEGEVIAELDLGQTILASPAIAGGALYLRSDATLWKIVE